MDSQNACRTAVSESWDPVTVKASKALDSGFRRNDEQKTWGLWSLNFRGKFMARNAKPIFIAQLLQHIVKPHIDRLKDDLRCCFTK